MEWANSRDDEAALRDRLGRLRAIVARCKEASRVVDAWLADPPGQPRPGG